MSQSETKIAMKGRSSDDPLMRIITKSRNKLIALFDGIDDEILVVNHGYIIGNVNRKKANRAEVNPKDLVGKRCYSIFSPGNKEKPCPFCEVQAVFQTGKRISREVMEEGEDGSRSYNEYTFFPIFSASGSTSQVIVYRRDIRDAKARRRLEKQMVHADKLSTIGVMTAGIAHEIHNPIGVVCTNVETLLSELHDLSSALHEGKELTDLQDRINDLKTSLLDIGGCAVRVRDISGDLKEFSRMGHEEMQLININEHLDKTLNIASNELKGRIVVRKEYGEIPQIVGYPTQLGQVFLNILINASHAIEGEGTITLRTSLVNSVLKVEISDNGVGIPEKMLPNIFKAFFTTKELGRGTGLGLSISQDIIRKHNGRIEVSSKVGEGTSIYIFLLGGTMDAAKEES